MKKLAIITLTITLTTPYLTGCIPVLIGAAAYGSAKSDENRVQFLSEFNRNNTEREKAGLHPLNKCLEIYKFDPSWAREFAECRDIIDSLKQAQKDVADSVKRGAFGK